MHICINGVWGSGKTTTVMGIIDYLERNDEKTRPLVLYLDIWKYEHYQEPLFALLKVMQKELPQIFDTIMNDIQRNKIKLQIGFNLPFLDVAMSEIKDDRYDRLLNEAEYIDALNEILIKVVRKFKEERSNELIIFIDELDRAKPDFALRTIEMLHHLQDDLPTHIIYSVDMNQLSSVIKHYYGYEYNVEVFTHKVFDEIISLKKLTKDEINLYIDRKIKNFQTKYDARRIRSLIVRYMSLNQLESLRTLNKICESIARKLQIGYFKQVHRDFSLDKYYLESRKYTKGYIELLVVLEIFSLTKPMKIYDFLRGDSIEELLNFIAARKQGESNKELEHLIATSFYFDKDMGTALNYVDLTNEEILIGIRRIFVPENEGFEGESVFSIGEMF